MNALSQYEASNLLPPTLEQKGKSDREQGRISTDWTLVKKKEPVRNVNIREILVSQAIV